MEVRAGFPGITQHATSDVVEDLTEPMHAIRTGLRFRCGRGGIGWGEVVGLMGDMFCV
jgi:hypothetical protein